MKLFADACLVALTAAANESAHFNKAHEAPVEASFGGRKPGKGHRLNLTPDILTD